MAWIDQWALMVRGWEHTRTRRRVASRGSLSPALRAQLAAWPDRTRMGRSWDEERFVVFDTETTGLDPAADRAVSLGAISVEGGRIRLGDAFHRVLATDVSSSRPSVIMHGLTDDKVASGVTPVEALGEFLVWIDDAILVAHHAAFDVAMLNHIAIELHGVPLQNLVLDTTQLAARVERGQPVGYGLDSLLERYAIPGSGERHTALGDALLTARLFLKLLKRLHARDVHRVRDLALSPAHADQ